MIERRQSRLFNLRISAFGHRLGRRIDGRFFLRPAINVVSLEVAQWMGYDADNLGRKHLWNNLVADNLPVGAAQFFNQFR